MDKCDQSLSDEWVPQGSEAQKCITLHPAFNTACLDRWSLRLASGKYRTIDKKLSANWFRRDVSYNSVFFLLDAYTSKGR